MSREEQARHNMQSERDEYTLAVIMAARAVKANPWAGECWSAAGVVCGEHYRDQRPEPVLVREHAGGREYLIPGLRLRLYKDEAESYYHNLMAPSPQLYVIARVPEGGGPMRPFHVTASFDEANAYLEADDEVYAVPMPPEVGVWMEQFVLTHYVPQPRKARKRKDWRAEGRR